MAQNPAFIVVALLLIAAATPLAHGQLVDQGFITGRLCCTPTGNCAPGSVGIPGVTVVVNCTNLLSQVVTVGQGVTNATGGFNITTSSLLGLGPVVSGYLSCEAVVKLPLPQAVCPVLSTATGVLAAVTVLVNTVVSTVGAILGFFTLTAFFLVGA